MRGQGQRGQGWTSDEDPRIVDDDESPPSGTNGNIFLEMPLSSRKIKKMAIALRE